MKHLFIYVQINRDVKLSRSHNYCFSCTHYVHRGDNFTLSITSMQAHNLSIVFFTACYLHFA